MHGGLARVALVELHFAFELEALRLQLGHALVRHRRHVINLLQSLGTFGVVGALVGVARDQDTLTAALFLQTGTLFGLTAALQLLGGPLFFGQHRPPALTQCARGPQHALLAVDAFRNGPV